LLPRPHRRLDAIDEADRADGAEIDRDHAPDVPLGENLRLLVAGIGRERGARAVAVDDVAEDAQIRLRRVAPLLTGRLAGFGPFNEHRWFSTPCLDPSP